jgi:hypothetical protein
MSNIKMYFIPLAVILTCYSNPIKSQHFVITGKAENAKLGPVVITPDNVSYFLDKCKYWDSNFIGKSIKVTGSKIVTKKFKQIHPVTKAATITYLKIIKKPKFEILKIEI